MSKIVSETEKTLNNMIISAIDKAVSTGALPDAEKPEFIIEKPADKKNGDFSTNAAMAGARSYHKAPRMIAEAIVSNMDFILVSTYEENGINPELVLYKKR